jgi:hypothetical protein
MALTKYDLVNTKGLKGISFEGDYIPLEEITNEIADRLEGKTHILKKKSTAAANRATAALTEGDKA